jgi:hypothetical protein
VPLAGAFWARGTHQAALITLVSGFIVGVHLASHHTLHYCRACELLMVLAFGCGRVAGRDAGFLPGLHAAAVHEDTAHTLPDAGLVAVCPELHYLRRCLAQDPTATSETGPTRRTQTVP